MRATTEEYHLVGYGGLAPTGERAKERRRYPLTQIMTNEYPTGRVSPRRKAAASLGDRCGGQEVKAARGRK